MFIQVDYDADVGNHILLPFFPASSFSRSLVLHVSLRSSLVYTAVMRDGGVRVCQGQCELVNWSLTARPSLGTLQQAIGVSLTFMR